MNVQEWRALGAQHEVGGRKLFVVDTARGGEGGDKPTLLVLHGYPTSSHDYHRVLDTLSARVRVVVHDHLGFGLSQKPRDYSYAVQEQADVALALWQQLGVRSAHLFAHDYGTSIATELLARWNSGERPIAFRSFTLCNGSVHIELARLRFIQKLLRNRAIGPLVARLSSQRMFDRNLRGLWGDPSRLEQRELDAMWELFTRDGGKAVLADITRYLRDRVTYWDRWVGALRQSQLPLNFLWGAADPITGRSVAEVHHAEAPGSKLTVLDGVGHYPMLEAPQAWASALLALLGAERG